MIGEIGVRFQPGGDDSFQQRQDQQRQSRGSGEGVQQAIKFLSLRLPKVVGAQAAVPTPLLTSGGSEGSPRVHSMVQQVMQQYFPTEPAPSGQVPSIPNEMPTGASAQSSPSRRIDPSSENNPWTRAPRVIVGLDPTRDFIEAPAYAAPRPGTPTWDGGFGGPQFGNVGTLPNLRQLLDWVPEPQGRDETPLI